MSGTPLGAAEAPADPPPPPRYLSPPPSPAFAAAAAAQRQPSSAWGGPFGAAAAAAIERQPSAWGEAFEEASLLSPMASSAYGRSVSLRRASLAAQLQLAAAAADLRGEEENSGRRVWATGVREAKNLCSLALPLSVTNLTGFCIGLVTLSFTGRLGEFEFSCAVLAISIFNVTGLSLLMGFAAAMETFCGQAFGAGNYRLVGVVFQRAIILTTIMSVGVAAVWSQAEGLLLFLRQDPLISRSAARYIQLCIPALWCTGMFEASKRYLMAQGVVRPPSVVTLIALALAPLYSWLFIYKLDWRLDGAAIAVDAVQLTMAVLLGGYIVVRDAGLLGLPRATWHGWSREALRGWPMYLRFALPSVAMICCEWWTFEAVIIMSGWLQQPNLSVAVMGICINTSGIIYMFVTGFAMATSTRVSNSLGAGCPKTACRATWTAVALTSGLEVAAMGACMALRHRWALLFTDAPAVVELTASLLPIFALTLPGDGINATLQGLLRGSGRQETGAVTNLCSYWVLGIPLAAYLAFKRKLGVQGLWWGLVVVNSVQGAIMLIIALRFDFGKEAEKAAARSLAHRGSLPDDGGSLRQPLLGAAQCERLEQGLLAEADGGAGGGAVAGGLVPAHAAAGAARGGATEGGTRSAKLDVLPPVLV